MDKTSPFRQRRFSAAEVRRIVRRAATLADTDPETAATEQSLSQAEIEQTAMSLGLPASTVRAAIADESPDDAAEAPAAGDSKRVLFEEELDGEVPTDRYEDLVDAIEAAMGEPGRAQVVGKTLTWTPAVAMSNQGRKLSITVRARDGKTRIRVDENLKPYFWGVYLGLGLGLGFSGAVTSVVVGAAVRAVLMGTGIGIAIALASLLLAQLIYGAIARRRGRELTNVMKRLKIATESALRSRSLDTIRTRVATEADTQAQAEAEADAEAEAVKDTVARTR